MNKLELKSAQESSKRSFSVRAQLYTKGRNIILLPNEMYILGFIVFRTENNRRIPLPNEHIYKLLGLDPQEINKACEGLVEKGLITKDTPGTVHGQQCSRYILREKDEAEQQSQATQNDNEVVALLKEQNKDLKEQNGLISKAWWGLYKRVGVIERDLRDLQDLSRKVEHLANVFNPQVLQTDNHDTPNS